MTRIDREESAWLMAAGAALTISVVAGSMLLAAPAYGQTSSGRGPMSWFGDITGSINQPSSTPPRQAAPPSRRLAQASPPKEWSGGWRPPLGCEFRSLRGGHVA